MKPRKSFLTNPISDGINLYRYEGWEGQLARVRRWHRRVQAFRNARSDPALAPEYLDFLYAFFQNCNHLADWISSDVAGGQTRVEQLVKETIELRICRDICNATKHFRLNRRPKVKDGFADGSEYVPKDWPTDHPIEGASWFVIAGGEKYDIFHLAQRCMVAWDRFVANIHESPVLQPSAPTSAGGELSPAESERPPPGIRRKKTMSNNVCPNCGGNVERSHGEVGVADMETGERYGQQIRFGSCDGCGQLFEPSHEGDGWIPRSADHDAL